MEFETSRNGFNKLNFCFLKESLVEVFSLAEYIESSIPKFIVARSDESKQYFVILHCCFSGENAPCKIYDVHAELLFCSLSRLFGKVLAAVTVVFC